MRNAWTGDGWESAEGTVRRAVTSDSGDEKGFHFRVESMLQKPRCERRAMQQVRNLG